MSFTELVTALWRNRVGVAIGLGALLLVLFTFNDAFQAMVMVKLVKIVESLFVLAIIFFGLSLLWKGAMGNFKGSGGKKK